MRKAKILATLGPASTAGDHRWMLGAGLNAVRINMSHGTHEEHAETIEHARSRGRDVESAALASSSISPDQRSGPGH